MVTTYINNFGLELCAEHLVGDILRVLGADDNGVYAEGNACSVIKLVLNGDLGVHTMITTT
jgi:hypothetical protein